jgi:hypothetical protein
MSFNGNLHVPREVLIGHRRVAELLLICPCQCDTLADFAAWEVGGLDDRYGAMVLLEDHVHTFLDFGLDFGQYGVGIASEFSFCDADRRHLF